MNKLFIFLIISIALICPKNSSASHSYGGYISYSNISGLTYQITVKILVDSNSPAAQRSEIAINYGDQTGIDSVVRSSIIPTDFTDLVEYAYISTHTFSGSGTYTVSVTDPNRLVGIDNVSSSINQALYLETTLKAGINNQSVELLSTPYFEIKVDSSFIHQLNLFAVDSDGDRLHYQLIDSRGSGGLKLTAYQIPSNASINNYNGTLSWQSSNQGLFLFTILIAEIRNGVIVSETTVDLIVGSRTNMKLPPTFSFRQTIPIDSCGTNSITLEAGDRLRISATAIGNSNADSIDLNAYTIASRINYNLLLLLSDSTVGELLWITTSKDIRCEPYFIFLRAQQFDPITNTIAIHDFAISVYVLDSTNSFCDTLCNPAAISVDEISYRDRRFKIYPNPAKEFFAIDLGEALPSKNVEILFYDANGRMIDHQKLNASKRYLHYERQNLPAGLYFLKLLKDHMPIAVEKVFFQ